MHHAIFGSSLAIGKYAALSADPYLRWGLGDKDGDSGLDDMDACTMHIGPRSGDKRVGTSRGVIGTKKRERRRLNMR